MPLIFADPDSGRINLVHHQPHLLTQAERDRGHEVTPVALEPPGARDGERMVAYWRDRRVEWEPVVLPDDDPQVVATRLKATEARLEALLNLTDSRALVTRADVVEEEARVRDIARTR